MAHAAGCSPVRCTYARPSPSSVWCVGARPLGTTSRMRPCRVACPTTFQSSSSSEMLSSAGQSHDVSPAQTHKPTQQQGGQQQHAWLVFKQCMMLAAAAFGGAPLILVLDVAENACLAVGQLQQITTQLFAATSSTAAAVRQHDGNGFQRADQLEGFVLSNAQQQNSQSQVQHVAAGAVLAAAAAGGSSTGFQQPASSNTNSRDSNAGHHRHMYNSTASNSPEEPLLATGNNREGGIAGSSSTRSTAAARASSSSSSSVRISRSSSRRPLLDLLPPWTPMALAVVPAALLALRHLHTQSVLQLLLWCGGSLICQAYINLLLVVLQRSGRQSAASTAAATVPAAGQAASGWPADASLLAGAFLSTPQQQQGPRRREQSAGSVSPSAKPSSHGWWAAGEASGEAAAANGYACATAGQGQQCAPQGTAAAAAGSPDSSNSSSSSSSSRRRSNITSSGMARLAVVVFEALQVAGDVFRVWCLCSAGWLVWQCHAAALPGHWASCLAAMHCSMAAVDVGHLLGAATAAAVSLHCCVDWCFWLVVDVGLAAAGAAMYALAVLPRVLPSVNRMCQ